MPAIGRPIEISVQGWIDQTVFWCRAVAAIILLAAGVVLLLTDWQTVGIPPTVWRAIIWGVPGLAYFAASFFVKRLEGQVCLGIMVFAIAHATAIVWATVWVASNVPSGPGLVIFLALAMVGGLGIVAVSAFWARKLIREPTSYADGARGFEVLQSGQGKSE